MLPSNPVNLLERGERPQPARREMMVLDREGIERMLEAAAPAYKSLLATALFTGLRLGALGLVWADVDLDAAVIHVRKQLDRDGHRVKPKTAKAVRDVELMPALVVVLRGHRKRRFSLGL